MQEEHLENTLSSLLHPALSVIPAQPPSPASLPQTAGEEGSMEGRGQTAWSSWDILLGYCLLKHNQATREAHSVTTPLNQKAQ